MSVTRIIGRSAIGVGALGLGITAGAILLGRLYLPFHSTAVLLALLGLPVVLVVTGGLLSRDRYLSVIVGGGLTLGVSAALLYASITLNLGLNQQTLLAQLPLAAAGTYQGPNTPWHPAPSSTLVVSGESRALLAYLRQNTELDGTTTLTKPLNLGKALTVTVEASPTAVTVSVVNQ